MKRGLCYAEALTYVGVRRRTFDQRWRPMLTPVRQGTLLIFDRLELDRLFDRFKEEALEGANSAKQNVSRNGRPIVEKGVNLWAERQRVSTRAPTEVGKSTSGGKARDFSSVASEILRKRSAG